MRGRNPTFSDGKKKLKGLHLACALETVNRKGGRGEAGETWLWWEIESRGKRPFLCRKKRDCPQPPQEGGLAMLPAFQRGEATFGSSVVEGEGKGTFRLEEERPIGGRERGGKKKKAPMEAVRAGKGERLSLSLERNSQRGHSKRQPSQGRGDKKRQFKDPRGNDPMAQLRVRQPKTEALREKGRGPQPRTTERLREQGGC